MPVGSCVASPDTVRRTQGHPHTVETSTATLLIGAIVAVNLAFLDGTSLWLISSARGTTAAVPVLGTAG